MPAFRCTKCGCLDNTAMGNYWSDTCEGKPALCTECDPEIGKWHGEFEKKTPEAWGATDLIGEGQEESR